MAVIRTNSAPAEINVCTQEMAMQAQHPTPLTKAPFKNDVYFVPNPMNVGQRYEQFNWLLAIVWIFVGLFLLAGCSEVADAQASYDSHQDAIAMAQAAGIPPANK